MLTTDQAWARCVRRRPRLRRIVARYGLPEHTDDVVHDVFVAVMSMPRLYPEGFDALLDTAVWRRCKTIATIEATQYRLGFEAVLDPGDTADHSDSVHDRVDARRLLQDSGALTEPYIWVLAMMSLGLHRREISQKTGTPISEVDRAIRGIRRRVREKTSDRLPQKYP
ncbi:hypothetical protein [Actinokineospora enzanensis]|uniref:hypothetical protein n=1 Tax=Actinokineospora enzanensis TaxID=155975 RepID=UPI00035EBC7D|nr:hypothetical protein [Actinokineospora enzanensis]